MTYIRMKFKKTEEARFISHLDLMRTFQRAIRRAKIPITYTAGFNPRPEMSFVQALGLGLESTGEYLDIRIKDEMELNDFINRINNNLPKGIKVLKSIYLAGKAKSGMSLVRYGQYSIELRDESGNISNIENRFKEYISKDSIFVEKLQPKKNKFIKIDIKPLIKDISFSIGDKANVLIIDCILSCGSNKNLKPELIIKGFEDYLNKGGLKYKIIRRELFTDMDSAIIPLIEVDKL